MEMIDAANNDAKQFMVCGVNAGKDVALRATVRMAGSGANVLVNALHSLRTAATEMLHVQRTTGKVSIRDFARTLTGVREIVDIDDRAVARELETTLKRYGVTFAIEKGGNGVRTFHVQGKDIQVVERALSAASQKIDEKIARNATRRRNADKITEGLAEKRAERETTRTRTHELGLDAPKVGDDEGPARSGIAR